MLMVKPRRFDMVIDRQQKYRQMAAQSKYQRLYTHLCSLTAKEWKTSFSEIESIMGFELPPSARLHRPWWANQSGGNGHSQAPGLDRRRMGDGSGGHGCGDAAAPAQALRDPPQARTRRAVACPSRGSVASRTESQAGRPLRGEGIAARCSSIRTS